VAGQRQEDVVEGRSAQRQIVDRDPGGVEVADDLHQALRPAVGRDRDPAGPVVDDPLAVVGRDQRGGARQVGGGVDHDLDPLAADLGLERIRGAAGDDPAVIDDRDRVGQGVGLLEVLGREQDRGAGPHPGADRVPQRQPAARVEAGGRLVEEEHPRSADQRARQVEAAPHAARVRLDDAIGGVDQLEGGEQLVGPAARLGRGQPVQAPEQDQVLAAGQVLVDRGVLPRQADHRTHVLGLGHDVEAGHRGASGIRTQERGQDPHRRGLAGAVGAEQAEHAALGDLEIEAGQGSDRAGAGAVGLVEALGDHRGRHGGRMPQASVAGYGVALPSQ
jgi:hypothetical protein